MRRWVPAIEVANQTDLAGIRRPDCKMNTVYAFVLNTMGTQHVPKPLVGPFIKKMEIKVAKHRAESIGIVLAPIGVLVGHIEHIGKGLFASCALADKQAVETGQGFQGKGRFVRLGVDNLD